MIDQAFLHGVILAFGLILPLGVQNIFIFNQGVIQKQWIRVLPVVITAALCDTLLILLAVLGVSAIVFTFSWVQIGLVIIGFFFLLYMAYLTWNTKQTTAQSMEHTAKWTIKRQVIFAITVSLLNPHALLDTIGVIGTTSLTFTSEDRILFTFGTILTSWLWFIFLSFIGRVVGLSDAKGILTTVINKVSAVIMALSAVYLMYTLL